MTYPAKTWRDAFNAFDPTVSLAADDPRYVDLSAGRGNEGGLVRRSLRKIQSSNEPITLLVAGHLGSGKTTELQRLKQALEMANFWVADLSLEQDLDIQDAQIIDILLALARQLEEVTRQGGVLLDPQLLRRIIDWFQEVVKEKETSTALSAEVETEAQAGGEIPFLAKLLTRLTGRIRTGTTSKKMIRQSLEPQITQLHSNVRDLILEARQKVRQHGKEDLVLIVDTLDRIPYLRRTSEDRSNQEVIFIERGELLRDLGCHLILTLPISLIFSDRHKHLESIFPDRFVVPMIKILDKRGNRPPTETGKASGWDLLREVLHRRIDPSWLTTEVEDALISASGGNPRQLISLARAALDFIDQEEKIPIEAVRKAVRQQSDGFGRTVPEEDWRRLAEVYAVKTVQNDAPHRAMLFNLSVLEYQNDERWCDVNPLILELPQFQRAIQMRNGPLAPPSSGKSDGAQKAKSRSRKSS